MNTQMQSQVAAKLTELKAGLPSTVEKIETEIRQWRETRDYCRDKGNKSAAEDAEAAAVAFIEILPPRVKADYTAPAWMYGRL
jgi:hypothetical protein